jgi:hypothetical protein
MEFGKSPMGRTLRASFLARRRLDQFTLQLRNKPVGDWPRHLRSAWAILCDELQLPSAAALAVIVDSVAAAHHCTRAQSEQLRKIENRRSSQICNPKAEHRDGDDETLSSQSAKFLTDYCFALGAIWRGVGLKPSRARNPLNPKYRSRFHRFAELILTEMMEPWTLRHDDNLDELRDKIRRRHAQLPEALRRSVSLGLRRADTEWLISEDHVRRAIQRLAASHVNLKFAA